MRCAAVSRILTWVAAVMLIGQGPAAWSCPCALGRHPDDAGKVSAGRVAASPSATAPQRPRLPPCCQAKRAGGTLAAANTCCGKCGAQTCAQHRGGCSACHGSDKRCDCGVRMAPVTASASESLTPAKVGPTGMVAAGSMATGNAAVAILSVRSGPDPPCPATASARLSRLCRFLL